MNKSYQDYKDPETVICQSPSSGENGGGGGGNSVWGYLTAAVVAANVVANIVNNVNANNNNNNNNNNQDSTNNNNMNIGNSANSNSNMNIIIPVPGGRRSLQQLQSGNNTEMSSLLHSLLCSTLAQNNNKELFI